MFRAGKSRKLIKEFGGDGLFAGTKSNSCFSDCEGIWEERRIKERKEKL